MTEAEQINTRIVILGASNVAMSLPVIVGGASDVIEAATGHATPIEFFSAGGHGRSYGVTSRVLVRKLPGITECGLWDALKDRRQDSTAAQNYALITDIGNDILYGFTTEQIMRWVGRCVEKLSELNARIVVSDLPLVSLEKLSRARFLFMRSIVFPSCRISFEKAQGAARDLSAALHQFAGDNTQVQLVGHEAQWYGFDPIHIKRRLRYSVYRRWMSCWMDGDSVQAPALDSELDSARPGKIDSLRGMRPALRWMWGKEQTRDQPTGKLANGSRLWMY